MIHLNSYTLLQVKHIINTKFFITNDNTKPNLRNVNTSCIQKIMSELKKYDAQLTKYRTNIFQIKNKTIIKKNKINK